MTAKIVQQKDNRAWIQWEEDDEFGNLEISYIEGTGNYHIDAEFIGIHRLLRILNALDMRSETEKILAEITPKEQESIDVKMLQEALEDEKKTNHNLSEHCEDLQREITKLKDQLKLNL